MEETGQKADVATGSSKMLQEELQKIGLRIKHHEDNLKFLKSQSNSLEESILDVQVSLAKNHYSAVVSSGSQNANQMHTEKSTIEHILKQENTAAAILCQLKTHRGGHPTNLPLTRDVLGIVATLGKAEDDNHSRLFSEYLGLENMLAVVCKTYEGVKALEMYDQTGQIDKSVGLHGLGQSIGRPPEGRFRIICLEDLIPYAGDFVAKDPQKKLALLKPRLPSGECPSGFLGFAVNMIHVDSTNLLYITPQGNGLRETLFYNLFFRLQVYKTRKDMQLALPCITDGAVSLDGGIIRDSGVFELGDRKEMAVRFPVSSGNLSPPGNINETAENLKLMNWEKERISEDVKREEALLNIAKTSFDLKKHALVRKNLRKSRNKQLKDVPVNDAKDGSFVRKRMHLFVECHTVSMFMAFFNE
ncbi:hypothetical protein ACLOJK_009876 [Asimina triloba]